MLYVTVLCSFRPVGEAQGRRGAGRVCGQEKTQRVRPECLFKQSILVFADHNCNTWLKAGKSSTKWFAWLSVLHNRQRLTFVFFSEATKPFTGLLMLPIVSHFVGHDAHETQAALDTFVDLGGR